MFEKLLNYFDGDVSGKTFAVWGLAFKPNTHDLREAPSKILVESILDNGGTVRAYDPVAMSEMRKYYPDEKKLSLIGTALDAVEGADALVIQTEWREFRSPDFTKLRSSMSRPAIFDGRNLYDPEQMRAHGIHYQCIGRPVQLPNLVLQSIAV